MGYLVRPSGRLELPMADEPAAVAAVFAAWETHGGARWVSESSAGTLADLGEEVAAAISRDGDWIEFAEDEADDPKWSMHATAFYVAIAPFVRSGSVEIEGEDGSTWSYSYADGQVTQQGWNGWDGSIEPFGEHIDPSVLGQS